MRDDAEYLDARRHVRARRGLYTHATVYVLVNAALLAIDLLTPGSWWFMWPLVAWSVGLGAHAAAVLVGGYGASDEWEEREIERWLERHGGRP